MGLITTPVAGSVLSVATFGSLVAQQFQEVIRAVDGSGIVSTTLALEPVLTLNGVANATYEYLCRFWYGADGTAAGFQAVPSIPSGASVNWETPDGTNGTPPSGTQYSGVLSGTASAASWATQNGVLTASITGTVRMGSVDGAIGVKVARTGGSGTLTIKGNSRLSLIRTA